MAYLEKRGSTNTSVTLRINGLSELARNYGAFRAKVSWGVWKYYYPVFGDNNYYSGNITIDGLSAGTSYTFNGQAQWNGTWYDVTDLVASTSGNPVPSAPNAPALITRGETSLALDWNNVSGATSYTLKYRATTSSEVSGITSSNYTLTGLSYGTSYYVSAKACNSSGCSAYSGENIATTYPKTPTVSVNSVGTTFINVNAWYMDGNWDGFRATVYTSSGTYVKTVTSASSPINITGLTPDTSYKIHVDSYVGSLYSIATDVVTASTAVPVPSVPNAPTLISRGEGSLNLDWNDVPYATSYTLKMVSWADSATYTTSASQYNATSLRYGTTYQVSVRACSSVCSSYSVENTATTAPKTPTTAVSATTNTSITITASGMEGNYSGFRAEVYTSGGTYVKAVDSSTSTINITGLTQGVTYNIYTKSFMDVSSRIYSVNSSYRSATTTSRPSNWSWTTTELTAFNNKGLLTALTYTRWNSFLQKINEFRTYKGLSTVSFNYMTSSDKSITATRFNQALNAINAMGSTGITSRSYGDVIYGSYFITMANTLNSL